MLRVCISIIGHYPKDLPGQEAIDLSLRGMFCNFMIATAFISLARSEDNVETELQDYLTSRKHTKAFDDELEARLPDLDEDCKRDLQSKLTVLLMFDFEAAVSLKSWDDLSTTVRKAQTCKDLNGLQTMADCILRAQGLPVQGTT
jgi:hypothetical protein